MHALSSFMALMNDVLCPYLDWFVIVYLNAMFVYSSTWEAHISHLKQGLRDSEKALTID